MELATRVLDAFRDAVRVVERMPLARPEHPEIRAARFVLFERFPYLLFYTVKDDEIFVVAIEYATRDYVDRVLKRTQGA